MKSIVVLGMHRSGTSLVAGILHRVGVHMGDRLMQANVHNPFGYYENWDFVVLNDLILHSAGGSWDDPPSRDAILQQKHKFEHAIKTCIRMNEKEPYWGWKDPRTCLTVELYHAFLKNPFYVICQRDKDAVVRSLVSRDGMDPIRARRLVETYDQRIGEFLDEYKPSFAVVKYENVSRDMLKLSEKIGFKLYGDSLRLIKTRPKVKLAKRIVQICDMVKGAVIRI